jgi:cation diffusion facilitator family transporter
MKNNNSTRRALKVSAVSLAVNLILSVYKLFAAIFAHSGAMLSDAVHSASDILSTVIVMIGVKFAAKDSDKEHQYGHERMECVAAIILSGMLFATGLGIGISAFNKVISGKEIAVPGMAALIAAIISILVKEGMYHYTMHTANAINSGALKADAWHHRSDALSSVGSFIGTFAARSGFPVLDPIASIVICIFIVKAAVDIFKDAINKMTDRACDEETTEEIRKIILSCDGVMDIDGLMTRKFGDKIYVDVEISADETLTLKEAHKIAETTHDRIEEKLPLVKHCMVHVNPYFED